MSYQYNPNQRLICMRALPGLISNKLIGETATCEFTEDEPDSYHSNQTYVLRRTCQTLPCIVIHYKLSPTPSVSPSTPRIVHYVRPQASASCATTFEYSQPVPQPSSPPWNIPLSIAARTDLSTFYGPPDSLPPPPWPAYPSLTSSKPVLYPPSTSQY